MITIDQLHQKLTAKFLAHKGIELSYDELYAIIMELHDLWAYKNKTTKMIETIRRTTDALGEAIGEEEKNGI